MERTCGTLTFHRAHVGGWSAAHRLGRWLGEALFVGWYSSKFVGEERLKQSEQRAKQVARQREQEQRLVQQQQQALLQEKQRSLLRILKHRFTDLSPEAVQQIELTADADVLEGWLERAFEVGHWQELGLTVGGDER